MITVSCDAQDDAFRSGCDRVARAIRRLAVGRDRPLLVAIDGRSGAGKSTLAASVSAQLAAVVVEGDDFCAGGSDAEWTGRTAAERADACIDWRRLRSDVLEPLLAGRAAVWRPFDVAAGGGPGARTVTRDPAAVVLLDGVYSGRPELSDLVDLAVLVEAADDHVRRGRLVAREGAVFMRAWHALWDAAEDHYFTHLRPRQSFDLVISVA